MPVQKKHTICPYCCHRFHPNEADFRLPGPTLGKLDKVLDDKLFWYHKELLQNTDSESRSIALQYYAINIKDYSGNITFSYDERDVKRFGFVQRINYFDHRAGERTSELRLCPNCHNSLPTGYGLRDTILISILGDARSGKSVFLTMLVAELENNKDFASKLTFIGDRLVLNNFLENYKKPLLKEHILINSTKRRKVPPFSFNYSYHFKDVDGEVKENNIDIIFYDIAGEDLRDDVSVRKNGFNIRDSSGLIYLVDPTGFGKLQDLFRFTDDSLLESIPKDNSNGLVFDTLYNYFLGLQIEKSNIPFALVLSKADLFNYVDFGFFEEGAESRLRSVLPGENHDGTVNMESIDALDKEVSKIFDKLDENSILNNAYSYFKEVKCFAVSSLGKKPREPQVSDPKTNLTIKQGYIGGAPKPFRVKEPFYWLLMKNGYLCKYEGGEISYSAGFGNTEEKFDNGRDDLTVFGRMLSFMRRKFIFSLVLVATFMMVACSNEIGLDEVLLDMPHMVYTPTEIVNVIDEGEDNYTLQTLSISMLNTAFSNHMPRFVNMFMEQNHDVLIEIDVFMTGYVGTDFMTGFIDQMTLRLMAGEADDLIFTWGRNIDYRPLVARGLIADWFPIMRADPEFDEGDYYMNVFKAASREGGLYGFPTTFRYEMIAANNNVPWIAEDLRNRNTITTADMLEIAREMSAVDDMNLHWGFNVFAGMWRQVHSFVDFENGIVKFDSPYAIDYLEAAREFTNFEMISSDRLLGHNPAGFAQLASNYYFINFHNRFNYHYRFLLPFVNELEFSGHVPLGDDEGNVLIFPQDMFILNANIPAETKALAWEFIKFMQNPDNHELGAWDSTVPSFSVYRPLMHTYLETRLPRYISYFAGAYAWNIPGSYSEAIESVIQTVEQIHIMPMREHVFWGQHPEIHDIFNEVLEEFHNGLITAEQAAANLQSQIALALMGYTQ